MGKQRAYSRRTFLQGAMAAAVGPQIVPARVLGLGAATAPSDKIVMASIGVGGQGTGNLRRFLYDDLCHVVAVCDVDKAHREHAAARVNEKYDNSDCAQYNDFREIVAREDIDAVCVSTPDFWHALITAALAKSGKDIYCEKPLANTVAGGRHVVDAVRRYGRVCQTGSHERSRSSVRYACELVRNGRIGALKCIRVNMPKDSYGPPGLHPAMPVPEGFDYNMWLGPCPYEPYTKARCHFYFRYILDYSGGEMTDRGAHIIDLGQLGHGSDDTGPIEIKGQGTFPRDGLFNTATGYQFECTYADGVKLYGSSDAPRGLRFEGTEGWIFIHIHGGALEADPPSLLESVIEPDEVHLGRSPNHHSDFLDAVRTRRRPLADCEIGHRTGTICHLVNIAMMTGRTLKWDPVAEQITNDEEANRMCARPMRAPWHF